MLFKSTPAEDPISSSADLCALAAELIEDIEGKKARREFERTARDIVEAVVKAADGKSTRSDLIVEPLLGAAIEAGIQTCLRLIRQRAANTALNENLREEVTRKTEIIEACTNAHQNTTFTYRSLRSKPKPRKNVDYLKFVEQSIRFLDIRVHRNWLSCDPGPKIYERLSACSEDDRRFFSAFFDLFCDEFTALVDDLRNMLDVGRECQDLYIAAMTTKEPGDRKALRAKLLMYVRRWTSFETRFARVADRFQRLRLKAES